MLRSKATTSVRPLMVVAGLLLTSTAQTEGQIPGGRQAQARVLIAAGSPVMLADGATRLFIALGPAASLKGIDRLVDLQPGDEIRYEWSREIAGVRIVDVLEAAPLVRSEEPYLLAVDQLVAARGQGRPLTLVDARPTATFREGHLPGACSLPWERLGQEACGKSIANSPLIVVYGSSSRDGTAQLVARHLLRTGATEVRVLRGGVREWVAAEQPLELAPEDVPALGGGAEPGVLLDVRPRPAALAARPAGSVSVPPEEFRWQEFDGPLSLPPLYFLGADANDPAPTTMMERIRLLRSARELRDPLELYVVKGGFAAWQAARRPVESGEPLRAGSLYRQVAAAEIAPHDFERLWQLRGGEGATFLDVRRAGTSTAPWVVKIPLEELPDRMSELPNDREILVFCSLGLRSHVAAELLRANGLRARFLRATTTH